MINAIISIVAEENDRDKKEKTCKIENGKRKALSSENNVRQIRHKITRKRNHQKYPVARELKRKLNLDYFYELLFTRENLKLVHIVCHDKQEHLNKRCDESKLFLYQENDD